MRLEQKMDALIRDYADDLTLTFLNHPNPFLPKEYVRYLEQSAQSWRKRYLKGSWKPARTKRKRANSATSATRSSDSHK